VHPQSRVSAIDTLIRKKEYSTLASTVPRGGAKNNRYERRCACPSGKLLYCFLFLLVQGMFRRAKEGALRASQIIFVHSFFHTLEDINFIGGAV
jgi:hypothetical protein